METLPASEFQRNRLNRKGTWAVAFLAGWCPFCRRFFPEFASLDGSPGFRVAVADLTSEQSPLWDLFGIEVVPAVVVFRDGRPVFREDSEPGVGLPTDIVERVRAAAASSPHGTESPPVGDTGPWGAPG